MRFFIVLLIGYVAATGNATDKIVVPLSVAGHTLMAEVAHTPASRARGLMCRNLLGKDSAMLFVFPRPDQYSMWMANTKIPLSVAFLDRNGVILNIEEMAPHTKTAHFAAGLAQYALEVNQGWFAARDIKAGEKVAGLAQAPIAE